LIEELHRYRYRYRIRGRGSRQIIAGRNEKREWRGTIPGSPAP